MSQAREMAIKIVEKDPELSSDQGKSLDFCCTFLTIFAIDYLKSDNYLVGGTTIPAETTNLIASSTTYLILQCHFLE